MSQIVQTEKEKKNKKRGIIVSSIFHVILIALCIYPFMSMTIEKEKGIVINFAPEYVEKFKPPPPPPPEPKPISQNQSAASEAPPEAPDMPEAQTAPAPEPEPTPPSPEPEPTPAPQPDPVPEPKPAPTPKPTPKPAVTQPQPTTPPASEKPQGSKTDKPVDKPTKPKQTEGSGKSTKPTDNPSSPTNPSKGTSSNSNEEGGNPARPGNGDSGKSPTPASGLGDGEEEQGGIGDLGGRRVLKRADLKSIVKKNGSIVIYICADRYGRVVKAQAVKSKSSIKDNDILIAAARKAKEYRFDRSPSSAPKDCMEMKFSFSDVE